MCHMHMHACKYGWEMHFGGYNVVIIDQKETSHVCTIINSENERLRRKYNNIILTTRL